MDGYELSNTIALKIKTWSSEHYSAPPKIELHPDDEELLRMTFRPPAERIGVLFGVPVVISSRAPRGGRIKPTTTQGG